MDSSRERTTRLTGCTTFDPSDRDISEFASEVGVVAMGSAMYECVLRDSGLLEHPERWQEAHRDRPVWVFTHRELPKVFGADIIFVRGDVRPVHADPSSLPSS